MVWIAALLLTLALPLFLVVLKHIKSLNECLWMYKTKKSFQGRKAERPL